METKTERIIVAISGGISSAICAYLAIERYGHANVLLYFNDTHWEHPDLYRFLKDIENKLQHRITEDSSLHSPTTLFFEERALANNRMPFCSRILKAERLQKFCENGDLLVFGIGIGEAHRARRIVNSYLATQKNLKFWFPMLSEQNRKRGKHWFEQTHIRIPELYQLGFEHNNCSGGCVRAGKTQWMLLYKKLPHVYENRKEIELSWQQRFKKSNTILRNESLADLQKRIDKGTFKPYIRRSNIRECFGVCDKEN